MGKRLIIFLVLIITAVFVKILFSAEKANLPNLKFTEGVCEKRLAGVDYSKRPNITKTSWLNENTLLVECSASSYCSGVKFTGSFELKGDSLLLKYKKKLGTELAKCVCFHTLNYELSNLPKKDYKIIFKE